MCRWNFKIFNVKPIWATKLDDATWTGVQSWALGQAALSRTMEGWGEEERNAPLSPPQYMTVQTCHASTVIITASMYNGDRSPNPPHWAAWNQHLTSKKCSLSSPPSPMFVIQERVGMARNDPEYSPSNEEEWIDSRHRVDHQQTWPLMQRTLSRTMERWGEYVEPFKSYCAPSTPLPSTIHDSVTLQALGRWKKVLEMSSGKGSSNKKIEHWCYTGKDFST